VSDFLKGFVDFRSTSDLEAYEKKISNWIQEVIDLGQEKELVTELLSYAKREEVKAREDKNSKSLENAEPRDGSRLGILK
jgi:hypothetical protein